MLRATRGLAFALATTAAAGCNTDAPNPFPERPRTERIPADARFIFTSDAHAARGGAPREAFAAREDGSGVQRLTFCSDQASACDVVEATASPDRRRLLMRRVARDTSGDGRLDEQDDAGLVALDLERRLEATIVEPAARVSGLDWAPGGELVLYSGVGQSGTDDIFAIQANGQDNRAVLPGAGASERRPRINATGNAALYERSEGSGLATVWLLANANVPVTQGGAPGPRLAGTPYFVGADADPAFAPDGRAFVFRRLTDATLQEGAWHMMISTFDMAPPRTLTTTALARGAPDWGPLGIIFAEFDGARWSIVRVAPDGSGRRVLLTLSSGQRVTSVRWLP